MKFRELVVQRNFIAILFYIQLLLSTEAFAAWTSDVSQYHEEYLLSLLAEVQARGEQHIVPFSTDGCSGGLSAGWSYLAKHFASFAENYGESPPWEYCCVNHDLVYWKGEINNGYQLRKQADQTLRQCVIDHGVINSVNYARQTGKSQQDIEESFRLIANLMYNTIRVGGRPCSVFKWRWGYGWPLCEWY